MVFIGGVLPLELRWASGWPSDKDCIDESNMATAAS
jgi:hypothetical protein